MRLFRSRSCRIPAACSLSALILIGVASCGVLPGAQTHAQLPPDPVKGEGLNPRGPNLPSLPGANLVAALDFSSPTLPLIDPASDPKAGEQQGFAPGAWASGSGLKQTQGATDNLANHLLYDGYAFGTPDGSAPARYGVSATVLAYKPTDSGAVEGSPTGILALCPYYQDPTHYMLLVAEGQDLSCWAVNGYRPAGSVWPQSAKLWDQWLGSPIKVGQPVTWGAQIDAGANSLTIYFDGQKEATVTSPLIAGGKHFVALAANGNYVQYTSLAFFQD